MGYEAKLWLQLANESLAAKYMGQWRSDYYSSGLSSTFLRVMRVMLPEAMEMLDKVHLNTIPYTFLPWTKHYVTVFILITQLNLYVHVSCPNKSYSP